jgi:hypothetical protein
VHAVVGAIATVERYEVQLPGVYQPQALWNPTANIYDQLTALARRNAGAQGSIEEHERIAAQFEKQAKVDGIDSAKKKELLDNAALHREAAAAFKTASDAYQSYTGRLGAPDDKGSTPLAGIIREGAIADFLATENHNLLIVKLHKSGGAYYTKKNLWAFFWPGIPLYHMGGVIASYVLLAGREGKVLKAGVIPVHGGFVKARKMEEQLKKAIS